MSYQSIHTGINIDDGISINTTQNSRLTALENKDTTLSKSIETLQNNIQTNANNIQINADNIQTNANNISNNTEVLKKKLDNLSVNYGGTAGTSGYCAMADIEIVKNYSNAPIEFKIYQRGKATPCWLWVNFKNANSVDPELNTFKHFGTSCGAILQKISTSKWRLWITKSEGYDSPTLISYEQGHYNQVTITCPKVFSTTKPSGTASSAL